MFYRRTDASIGRTAPVALLLVWFASLVSQAATVSGSVETVGGDPADDARVVLVELARSMFVTEDGTFRFEDVPDGAFHLSVTSPRHGKKIEEIEVRGDTSIEIVLAVSSHEESIVVSVGTRRGGYEVYKPVEVLDQVDISQAMQPTLGETLSKQPGVQATSFAPGSSRPIIRGQSGGRIRMLEGGLDVGDASTTSPDHAVTIDPSIAESIEILRGPATLLYGSSAIGGAVNVIDRRVPEYLPKRPIEGSVDLRYGSVARERAGSAVLEGGAGSFAWHVHGAARSTDDYEIPGNAVEDDPTSPEGTLPNSALENSTVSLGGSWVGKLGFIGAAVRAFDTKYGIPAELEEEEEAATLVGTTVVRGGAVPAPATIGEDGVAIDLEQRRIDVRGAYQQPLGPFRELRVAIGRTDYEHVELESGEPGTTFLNESTDTRIEVPHGKVGETYGVIGAQVGRRDFEAIGAEAFVPPSVTDSLALFALQEFERDRMSYELGLRYENQDIRAEGFESQSFDGLSASAGLVWRFGESWSLGGSIAHSVRLPSAEELYSDGPHLATLSYERGDPTLNEESSLGVDVSLRRRQGWFTGELSLFMNDFDDFIYEFDTGEVEDGLPVFQFTQGNAEFAGYEFVGVFSLIHEPSHDLDFELRTDRVRATLTDGDVPLPRIPADRYGASIRYRGERLYGSVSALRTDDQDRVSPSETSTDGYTIVDAIVGYRFLTKGLVHDVMLRGTNLTNEEARPHTSRLKQFVPLPGRDISVVYRLVF